MRPETRADRAIAQWRAGAHSEAELREAIARQVGEAVYFERQAVLRSLRETARLLVAQLGRSARQSPDRLSLDGQLAGLRKVAAAILYRNHHSFEAAWPGFAHRKRRGRDLRLSRIVRELELEPSSDPKLQELSRPANRFPSKCYVCSGSVPTGEGILEGEPGAGSRCANRAWRWMRPLRWWPRPPCQRRNPATW